MGYNLTDQEKEWVNAIQARVRLDLEERGLKADFNNVLTTAIFAVTLFTRKLKLVDKTNPQKEKK